jgi:hypothetical protein
MPTKAPTVKKKIPAKTVPQETPVENYVVTLYVSGIRYTVEAPTLEEAILALRPTFLRGRVVITVKHGDKSKERILQLATAQSLFNTRGILKAVTIKNYLKLFDL